jgi:hypothetical protein
MELLRDTIWKASDGKVFKNKTTGIVYNELILLAVSDSIDNYEEVDKPVEPEVPEEEEVI